MVGEVGDSKARRMAGDPGSNLRQWNFEDFFGPVEVGRIAHCDNCAACASGVGKPAACQKTELKSERDSYGLATDHHGFLQRQPQLKSANCRARLKISRNIGRVSLPVLVFCKDG